MTEMYVALYLLIVAATVFGSVYIMRGDPHRRIQHFDPIIDRCCRCRACPRDDGNNI